MDEPDDNIVQADESDHSAVEHRAAVIPQTDSAEAKLQEQTGSPAAAEQKPEVPAAGTNQTEPNNTAVTHRRLRRRTVFAVFGVVFFILFNAAGAAGNIYLHTAVQAKPKISAQINTAPINGSSVVRKPAAADVQITTLHYVSKALHVEFDYPVDWRIGGTADDKMLSLTSAPFSIPASDGSKQQGDINLTIADPSQEQGSFGIMDDSGTISVNSQALAYTNPSSVQRKSTNISFESANSEDAQRGYSDSAFISGNLVYRTGQTVGSQKYLSVTPHIYAYFDPCHVGNGHCQAFGVNVSFNQDTWQNDPNFTKLRNLIKSLRFSQ